MSSHSANSSLADLPEAALWSSRSWSEFARLNAPERHVALLPLFGFADWGLGRSLDLEELVGCGVLRAMLATDKAPTSALTILPPLRFILGPYPHTLFGIDFETALDLVREIAASVQATGLHRLVLFNTSPWNEELAGTCACDLRAEFGLQTSVINLEALGLDLHPVRSTTRSAVQSVACALTRRAPSADVPRADMRLPDFRPGDIRQPSALPFTRSLDTASADGWTALADAGARLAALLAEIHARPPLPRDGSRAPARSTKRRPR